MAASVLCLALVTAEPERATPLPDPQAVRDAARTVLSRPEYQQQSSPDDAVGPFEFFWRLLVRVFNAIGDWFDRLRRINAVLAWTIFAVLAATAVALLAHIGWTIFTVARGDRGTFSLETTSRKKIDPVELLRQADMENARGNYILGVRLLFRACLARLEQVEGKAPRIGATNREYLNRYRSTPLYEWMARFVSVIDLKWYGSEPCVAADFADCREAYEQICSLAARAANA